MPVMSRGFDIQVFRLNIKKPVKASHGLIQAMIQSYQILEVWRFDDSIIRPDNKPPDQGCNCLG